MAPPAVGENARGPLRVHPANPRYFTDGSGQAIYLAGWNVWSNLQDGFGSAWEHGWGNRFDFDACLEDHVKHHLNYIRLWLYETAQVTFPAGEYKGYRPDIPTPNPWRRTGPGKAADGGPKFGLTQYNPAYFDRLRSRVAAAGRRGLYVSIMLFEGWSVNADNSGHEAWSGHPFNAANNTNGINGDPDGDGEGDEIYSLRVPAITRLQEAYVRQVIDTVNDLDNVLYEIANEAPSTSDDRATQAAIAWQYHMIRFIKAYEARKPKQHPVQMSAGFLITNNDLLNSPAEAMGPGLLDDGPQPVFDYHTHPPVADGRKVIIADTDHLGWNKLRDDPAQGRAWAWKNFTRGNNASLLIPAPHRPGCEEARRALGDTRRYATRMNLAAMTPCSELASTQYCLAAPGKEYLVYVPVGGAVTIDLTAAPGKLDVEWFHPQKGQVVRRDHATGGAHRELTPPFEGDAVLYIVPAAGR